METKKLERLYQMIAEKVNHMIPDVWNKLYLYAEVLWDSRCVYFDFESATKNKFIYFLNIPSEYNVDEDIFMQQNRELIELFEELHKEFKMDTPQPWNSLTMYLERSGKFKMDYNYDEVKLAPHEQRIIWKYMILGIHPTNDFDQKIVDEYLKNNEEKHE